MLINGKELRITIASFQDGMALQKAVGEAIQKAKLSLNIKGEDALNQELSDDSMGSLINTVISIGISKEVENCLFKCAEKALYNDQKINYEFFEVVENRELYYPIMIEIAKVNLMPFLKGLFSQFTGLSEKMANILK